ncbi:hypothetical protein [Microbacterium lacticum]
MHAVADHQACRVVAVAQSCLLRDGVGLSPRVDIAAQRVGELARPVLVLADLHDRADVESLRRGQGPYRLHPGVAGVGARAAQADDQFVALVPRAARSHACVETDIGGESAPARDRRARRVAPECDLRQPGGPRVQPCRGVARGADAARRPNDHAASHPDEHRLGEEHQLAQPVPAVEGDLAGLEDQHGPSRRGQDHPQPPRHTALGAQHDRIARQAELGQPRIRRIAHVGDELVRGARRPLQRGAPDQRVTDVPGGPGQ